MRAYYERRAPEYDDWYRGVGRFAQRDRPGWEEELEALCRTIATLRPARVLDVACGTGFLTRHLRGSVTALDQSESMLAIAGERLAHAEIVRGDAFALPFPDRSFERLFTGHFYGHLQPAEREPFLCETRRVADELVVVDTARGAGMPKEDWPERELSDGSRHRIYKRWFRGEELLQELGGGEVLHEGRWFVAVRAV